MKSLRVTTYAGSQEKCTAETSFEVLLLVLRRKDGRDITIRLVFDQY
jgi:hypothetical protein